MYANSEVVSFNKPNDMEAYYVVTLSDGQEIYQDTRLGQEHAWNRLKIFLSYNPSIKLVGMRLERNGVKFEMPQNQLGYFFGLKHKAIYPGPQQGYVGCGYFDGEIVSVRWFSNPGFKQSYVETRTPEQAGFFLIKNG